MPLPLFGMPYHMKKYKYRNGKGGICRHGAKGAHVCYFFSI